MEVLNTTRLSTRLDSGEGLGVGGVGGGGGGTTQHNEALNATTGWTEARG